MANKVYSRYKRKDYLYGGTMKTKKVINTIYKLMELSYIDIPVTGSLLERVRKAIRLIVYKKIKVFEWR
jgi:hypothetical protein